MTAMLVNDERSGSKETLAAAEEKSAGEKHVKAWDV
jgi:hypothetical protein